MFRRPILISITLTLILLASCSLRSVPETPPVSDTPEPSPSSTPVLTSTPLPPSLTPTIVPTFQPMAGTVRIATNVRSLPSKGAGERIGGLFLSDSVQVLGRTERAEWLWINYASSPTGTGWVTAKSIELQGEMGYLPIIVVSDAPTTPQILQPFIYTIAGTPIPLNNPPAGALTATVTYMANVRIGPSIGFLKLGTLPPGSIVTLTGRLENNDWLQIDYPSGYEGRAWISANALKLTEKPNRLPKFNVLGTPIVEAADTETSPTEAIPTIGTPLTGTMGETTILLNVRSGPSQSSQPLGTLKAQSQMILLGRTTNRDWYLIQYVSAPNGRAWVSAEFVKITHGDANSLPLYDEQGNPLAGP